MARNGADILIETLMAFGVDTIYGLPGDGINGIMESIRQHGDKLRFIQVRHEESAAFAAVAHAKFTGRLGCCLATTGPGGTHLLTGLYDAKFDRAPVIAITGSPFHDLADTYTQQDVDHSKLFMDVATYTVRINGVRQMENATTLACRHALGQRGVAHLAVPADVQEDAEDEDQPSPRNILNHVSLAQASAPRAAAQEGIVKAAEILNAGKRVAILAGQGAYGAVDELLQVAEMLGAPIIKALQGKGLLADDHPLTIGGIGLLGTRPSQEAMEACDTLLVVGSTFPYIEYYPKPEQARGVQIDLDSTRIGVRFPAEVGLVGDARETLVELLGHLQRKEDRRFLEQAQQGYQQWRDLLRTACSRSVIPMPPGRAVRDIGDRLNEDAVIAWDSGHNTGLVARYLLAKTGQGYAGSGLMASMGCAIPYAIAAALVHPGRQIVAFCGDGGLSMLMGELITVSRYRLPIKIVVIKNNTLGQIKWEQMMFLGNPETECDLTPIDFAKVAEACGIRAWHLDDPEYSEALVEQFLAHPEAALLEVAVDPNEPLLPPKRNEKYASNLQRAIEQGTPGAEQLREALSREPAVSMLKP